MADLSLASLYDAMHSLERVIGPFPVLTFAIDRRGRVVMSNRTARDAFGLSEVAMLDKRLGDLVPDLGVSLKKDPHGVEQAVIAGGAKGKPQARAVTRAWKAHRFDDTGRKTGVFPVEAHASALTVGDDLVIFIALHDLSEKLKADRALRQSDELLQAVLSGVPALISAKGPDGRYAFLNTYAAEIFGVDTEAAVGRTSAQVFGATAGRPVDALDRDFLTGRATSRTFEESLPDSEGRDRRFVTTKGALREPNGKLRSLLSVSIDISHRDAAEQRLERLAQHDDLTGLPRRPALLRALATQISQAKAAQTGSQKGRVGVMILSVDNLSEIGAAHGQAARDTVIRRIAVRLSGLVDDDAILAMIESDSFAIGIPTIQIASEMEARKAAIVKRSSDPVPVGQASVVPVISAGASVWPESGLEAEDLIRSADMERRHAEASARTANAALNHGLVNLQDKAKARRALEQSLRRDLEHDRLKVLYEPTRALASNRLIGFRALLCNADGQPLDRGIGGGVVPLTIAEQEGLVVPIGEWLIRRACTARRSWDEIGGSDDQLCVTLPLHVQQLYQPDLVEMVSDILAETNTPAGRLILSVKEAAAMDDPEVTQGSLKGLAEIGVGLSIEAFGTGASSLMHLRRLPVASVVLAPELIAGIPKDPDAVAIVSASIQLLGSLDKVPAAMGITTEAQATYLREIGCAEGTGPLIGAAKDAQGTEALVAQGLLLAV
jgi:diguanylate cyclase (GGDEF)-like protein/PAS domain S-box-containing protein